MSSLVIVQIQQQQSFEFINLLILILILVKVTLNVVSLTQYNKPKMKDNKIKSQRQHRSQKKSDFNDAPKGSFHVYVQRNIATANAQSDRKFLKTANNKKRVVKFDVTGDSNHIQGVQLTTPTNLISLTSRTRSRIISTRTTRQAIREHIINMRRKEETSEAAMWMKQPITFEEYMNRIQKKSKTVAVGVANTVDYGKSAESSTQKKRKSKHHKKLQLRLNQSSANQDKAKALLGRGYNRFEHKLLERELKQGYQKNEEFQDLNFSPNGIGKGKSQQKKQKNSPRNKLLPLKEHLGLGTIGSCLPFYRIKIQSQSRETRNDPTKIKTHKFKLQYPLVQLNKQAYSQSVRSSKPRKQIQQNQENF